MFSKIEKSWAVIGVIAAIFIAGSAASIDYWELRSTVQTLDVKEASRTYWRILSKMKNKKADIYEMAEWCEAAHKLGYDCKTEKYSPSLSFIPKAQAGNYTGISREDYYFFREAHNQYQYWLRSTGGVGYFRLSNNTSQDRFLKNRFCRLGTLLQRDLNRRLSSRYRKTFICPTPFLR